MRVPMTRRLGLEPSPKGALLIFRRNQALHAWEPINPHFNQMPMTNQQGALAALTP